MPVVVHGRGIIPQDTGLPCEDVTVFLITGVPGEFYIKQVNTDNWHYGESVCFHDTTLGTTFSGVINFIDAEANHALRIYVASGIIPNLNDVGHVCHGACAENPELIVNGTFETDFSGWSSSGLSQGQGYQFGQTNEGAFGHNAQFYFGGST